MSSVPVPNPAAPYRPTAPPAPLRLPPAPRRVSGPPRREVAETVPRSRLSAAVIRLIDHPLLERLVRGRVWIALVATALLGIVAMQVVLLRLGSQIGTQTQAYNVLLQKAEAAETAIGGIEANNRLSNLAGPSTGMVYAPPGLVTYLQVNPGDGRRAADRISTPTSAAIVAAADAAAAPAKTSKASKTSKSSTPPANSGGTTAGGASDASAGDVATTSQNALKILPPNSGTGAPTGTQLSTNTPATTVPVTGTATTDGTAATTGQSGGTDGAVTTSAGGTTPPASDSTTSAGGTQTGP
ncbi:MAG TPA: hypothetical protein VHX66_03270 [Solirubrobacteraceae bacterium]|nr:hypothetical protein [Solirubrobacteraceae bacterium]